MKNLTDRVLEYADAFGMLPEGVSVLCALSGGADSMAMLTVLRGISQKRKLTLFAAHFNHRLRGEEAQRDEDFVRHWCRMNGVPLTIGGGDVAKRAAEEGVGIEAMARTMRYEFLYQTADAVGADVIATAHNADDNAETVLLHLIRGAGLDGLTGIPPVRGNLIRPMLGCTRVAIEDYLAWEGVPHVEDSTNSSTAYARNRVRREIMPVLRSLNPRFSETLADNLPHLRADRDYFYALADKALETAEFQEDHVTLDAKALSALPRPVGIRTVKQALAALGRYEISAVHLESVLELAASEEPAAELPLPQGLFAQREYDRLILTFAEPDSAFFAPLQVDGCGKVWLENGWQVEISEELYEKSAEQTPWDCYLRRESAAFPLTIRPRQTGDRLRLPGRNTKTLKKWYVEEKIPRRLREGLPVAADEQGILAAAGLGPEETRAAAEGQSALRIRFFPPSDRKKERI